MSDPGCIRHDPLLSCYTFGQEISEQDTHVSLDRSSHFLWTGDNIPDIGEMAA